MMTLMTAELLNISFITLGMAASIAGLIVGASSIRALQKVVKPDLAPLYYGASLKSLPSQLEVWLEDKPAIGKTDQPTIYKDMEGNKGLESLWEKVNGHRRIYTDEDLNRLVLMHDITLAVQIESLAFELKIFNRTKKFVGEDQRKFEEYRNDVLIRLLRAINYFQDDGSSQVTQPIRRAR